MTNSSNMESERPGHNVWRENQATKWTDDIITGAIYAIKENGEPINAASLERNHNDLIKAVQRRPGGWKKYVDMAGFIPEEESAVGRGFRSGTNTAKLIAKQQKASR